MSETFQSEIQPGEIETEQQAIGAVTKTGFASGPGFENLAVEYVEVDGLALWQGCIELGAASEVERESATHRSPSSDSHGVAAADLAAAVQSELASRSASAEVDDLVAQGVGLPQTSSFLWTDGRMPYVISNDLPNADRVTDAITHWEDNTGMSFVQRTAANAASYPNYVEFVRNPNVNWSSSAVGMRGGRQLIRVSDAASSGTIIHEIGHAFGHMHEQTRSDRDDHVTIKWENINEDFVSNFQKNSSMTDYYQYDYDSIMHYPKWAFSKNGQDTIVPIQAGVSIGQRTKLSYGDRLANAKMYERFYRKGHSGVWRSAGGAYGLWVNASWPAFQNKVNEWSAAGLRLTDVNVHRRFGQTRYSGVWGAGAGNYGLVVDVPWSTFVSQWSTLSASGLRLVDSNVHNVNGQNRYSGVFRPGSGAYGLWANATWSSFKQKWQEWGGRGLRLVDVNVHQVNGQTRYTGVWTQGGGVYGLWANVTWSSFIAKWGQWSNQGLRLLDLNVHKVGSQNRYSGVFGPGNDGYYLWANVTWDSFKAKWEQLNGNGMRLIDYEWPHTGTGPSFDGAGNELEMLPPAGDAADVSGDGAGFVVGLDESLVPLGAGPGRELSGLSGSNIVLHQVVDPTIGPLDAIAGVDDAEHGGAVFVIEQRAHVAEEAGHGGLVLDVADSGATNGSNAANGSGNEPAESLIVD